MRQRLADLGWIRQDRNSAHTFRVAILIKNTGIQGLRSSLFPDHAIGGENRFLPFQSP